MDIKVAAAVALTIMVIVPIGLGYCLNIEDVEKEVWETVGDTTNISGYLYNDSIDTYKPYTGPYNNAYGYFYNTQSNGKSGLAQLNFVTVNNTYSSIPVRGDGSLITVTGTGSYLSISDYTSSDSYTLNWNGNRGYGIKYVTTAGVEWGIVSPEISGAGVISTQLIKSGTTMVLAANGQTIENVASVQVSIQSGQELQIIPQNVIIGYAQITDGWFIDANTSMQLRSPSTHYIDGRLLINMPINSTVSISGANNYTLHYLKIDRNISGDISATSYVNSTATATKNIGDTDTVCIEVDYRGNIYTVSSVEYWPQLGQDPVKINTVELERYPGRTIDYLKPDNSNIHFRMDALQILDSTVPVAHEKSLNIHDVKPEFNNCQIKFSNVLIPGRSITLGQTKTFYTDGNKLIVSSNQKVPLEGMVISYKYTPDPILPTYDIYVNNTLVNSTHGDPTIRFNGDWGATWEITEIEKKTITVPNTWVPGHMGIDMSEAALIGIATCAALFIILGMTGKMSGKKAALLGLICGSGAVIFFMLI